MKRKIALLMSMIITASVCASCGEKKDDISVNVDEKLYSVNFADYKDSEDIPDWEGEKLKLRVWRDVSSGSAYHRYKQSEDDVVSPEYERITGVSFDYENSFDNGGNSFDAMVSKIVAAEDYPMMATDIPDITDLVDIGALYELGGYIEKYCPNIMKYFGPESTFKKMWKTQEESYGGLYALCIGEGEASVKKMVEEDGSYDLTEEQITSICGPGTSPYGYMYIREDALKKVYPQAHTCAELEEIYKKNGKFTKEEIFDVPFDEPQDVIDFLYELDKVEIPDDGKGEVYTFYTHDGGDNWTPCTSGLSKFGYSGDYFSYYDLEDETLKFTFKEPWFKEVLKTYNKLIRDGVAASEALIDTKQNFLEKYNNGRYLAGFYPYPPTNNLNNEYKFRKVYMKFDNGYEKILNSSSDHSGANKISFFKSAMSEAQLIQALRAIDFSVSLPGQKLIFWGPKSAGLYTEDENGKLQYVDQNLANQLLDDDTYGNDLIQKYGLREGPFPNRPRTLASQYSPFAYYNRASTWESAYNPAYIESIDFPICGTRAIYDNTYTALIPEAKRFWAARTAFEDELQKVFAAENDEQFEERYNNFIKIAEDKGLTDETLEEFKKLFMENNAEYMDGIKEFKANLAK